MWQSITAFCARARKSGALVLPGMAVAGALWWWQAAFLPQATPVVREGLLLTPPAAQAAAEVAAQAWFGMAPPAVGGLPPDITVLGILAGQGGSDKDFVLVRENGQSLMLKIGQQAPAGWTVRQLSPQSIRIEKAGVVYELPLSRSANGQPLAVALPSGASPPPSAPAAAALVKEAETAPAMPPATLLLQD